MNHHQAEGRRTTLVGILSDLPSKHCDQSQNQAYEPNHGDSRSEDRPGTQENDRNELL